MLANSVKLLLVCAATGMLSACSTPCDAPGQLCAPIESNTRALPPPPRPAPIPAPLPKPAAPEPVTFAVAVPDITSYDEGGKPNLAPVTGKPATGTPQDMPAATAPAPSDGKVHHIGLLLPLRSASLGPAASLLRAGFMAAYERDRSGFEVAVIDTGDGSDDVLNKFAQAQQEQDIVVGPLSRSAVTAVANSDLVKKPTIALNHPDNRGEARLPAKLLVMGLSIEAEARQVAAWAASEQPRANALILSANSASQRRTSTAFKQEWLRQGGSADQVDLTPTNGYLSDAELVQLRARLSTNPPALIFAALDADQARQLRVAIGPDLPLYGTSSLNPGLGRGASGPELDGARLLDLPWQVQRDHPQVMVYPQPPQPIDGRLTADMERLYALGIDAFRVAREVALRPEAPFTLDGVTGRLAVRYDGGQTRFERTEQAATYQQGVVGTWPPKPVPEQPALLPAAQ